MQEIQNLLLFKDCTDFQLFRKLNYMITKVEKFI